MTSATLYERLPAPLQNAACCLEGWRIRRDRYSKGFYSFLNEYEGRTSWSDDQMRAFCTLRLRRILIQASSYSQFYRERFELAGLDPASVFNPDDLRALPLLTKTELKAHQNAIVSQGLQPSDARRVHTSGTTGGGLKFIATRDALREQWAVWWRYRKWHGIGLGTWCAYFGGRSIVPTDRTNPPFWRYNLPGRQIMFSAYHFSRSNMPAYIGELRRRKTPWLHGYPSILALLASYIVDTGTDLGYAPTWVTTGAENLLPQQRLLISRAFGVNPRQHYGMAEAVANFSECQLGRLHIDEDFAAVEFIPIPNTDSHRIIGTNFSNPATPLIRYEVGDTATLDADPCPCGRPGRIVLAVDGRMEDYVLLADGTRVGRLDHAFKDLVNIEEAQIHQREAGEVTLRIVRGANYTKADEELATSEVKQRLGKDMRVLIEYVDSVERSHTGKLRFVISELNEASINTPSV